MEFLEYDGQQLHWRNPRDGKGDASYAATSGLPGWQRPSEECVADAGPTPQGLYRVLLMIDSNTAMDDGTGRCALKPAPRIQRIPRGIAAGECEPYWANWGYNRVAFVAANAPTLNACAPRRGGFYLHDSTKGYSHGCIEVENGFFTRLYQYVPVSTKKFLPLQVQYEQSTTNGGTKVP